MAATKGRTKDPTLERTTYKIVSESQKKGLMQVVFHDHWSDGKTTSRTVHVPTHNISKTIQHLRESASPTEQVTP